MLKTRFLVPDLSPRDRAEWGAQPVRWIFVAESPHVSEIAPESKSERRPLCGVAGRQWWSLLSEILEGVPSSDISLPRLLDFSRSHGVAVMNAVQYPLDPKITREFPDADPLLNLGFFKGSGEYSFKQMKKTKNVQERIADLTSRLRHSSVQDSRIYCLGNDAEWFVAQALGEKEYHRRVLGKVPHPSAWWRRGGEYGRIAREKLVRIFLGDPERQVA